jgi:hypothetical protein
MLLKSAETANPVLVGFVPGATLTVNNVVLPVCRELGFELPVPLGFVGAGGVEFIGVSATPRNALLVPAEASTVMVPLMGAL